MAASVFLLPQPFRRSGRWGMRTDGPSMLSDVTLAVMTLPFAELPLDEMRPILRVEYEELAGSGCFDEERVELLYGAIVRMSPVRPDHDPAIQALTQLLVRAL